MSRIIIVFSVLLMTATVSQACDACGCKLSGFSFGILPQYTSHFVGLRYTHAAFGLISIIKSLLMNTPTTHTIVSSLWAGTV